MSLISGPELARRRGCSRQAIDAARHAGRIASVRVGRQHMFLPEAVAAFLATPIGGYDRAVSTPEGHVTLAELRTMSGASEAGVRAARRDGTLRVLAIRGRFCVDRAEAERWSSARRPAHGPRIVQPSNYQLQALADHYDGYPRAARLQLASWFAGFRSDYALGLAHRLRSTASRRHAAEQQVAA